MKNLKLLPLAIVAFALTFTSCKKDPEDRIPGEWNVIIEDTWTETEPDGTTETDSESLAGTAVFNDDGTAIMTIGGEAEALTWIATEEDVTLIFDGEPLTFEVVENEKKTQEWKYSDTESEDGYTYSFTLVIKMTAK